MDKNERLTTKQVSEIFNINNSTLKAWRRYRGYDKRYPRYHKMFTGMVFYIRHEIEADIGKMEIKMEGMVL